MIVRVTAILAGVVGLAAANPAFAQQAAQSSASIQASPDTLPNIAGMWLPDIYPFLADGSPPGGGPLPPELKTEAAAKARAHREGLLSGSGVDRGYCESAKFGGRMPMNVGGVMEILLNPGRVTIATEAGLVRRLYLDPDTPEVLDISKGGTSTARWEGSVLIVQTSGMLPNAWFLPGVELGNGATSAERFLLAAPDRLRIETTLIAPDLLTAPLTLTNTYHRAPDRIFTEFDTCPGSDRSFDNKTGREQFDATPPEDLPPPPSS